MTMWTIFDRPSGAVLWPGFATPDADTHPSECGWDWDAATQDAVIVDRPPIAAEETFDSATGTWSPDLTVMRDRRWGAVKARRDQAEWSGCNTALGRVDSDPDSQRKTGGAVQMAMIAQAAGAPFSIDWTMQDNSTVAHDAAAMIAMGVAVGQHVAACHEAALAKRTAIDAASTAAAIEAVEVETGWPA